MTEYSSWPAEKKFREDDGLQVRIHDDPQVSIHPGIQVPPGEGLEPIHMKAERAAQSVIDNPAKDLASEYDPAHAELDGGKSPNSTEGSPTQMKRDLSFKGPIAGDESTIEQPNSDRRIWGLKRRLFWIIFAVAITVIVVAAAVGAGVGVAVSKNKKSTLSLTTSASGTSSPQNTPSTSTSSTSSTSSATSSSGTPAASVAANIPTLGVYSYYGCVTDNSTDGRALDSASFPANNQTTELCATSCTGYKYFGTEYGRECWCGAALTYSPELVADSECNMVCGGDKFEYCGGSDRLTVYIGNLTNT